MAINDPLENIMTLLRQKDGVAPGSTGQMLPGMQMQRGNLGANIPQRGAPGAVGAVGAPGAQLPDRPSPEEGTETDMTTPQTAIPIILDALNESIIALKVEIHRTTDPEQRRHLEKITGQLRSQIQELGGEPIWADESIEEGLQKLTGHGYVGQNAVNALVSPAIGVYNTLAPYFSAAGSTIRGWLSNLPRGAATPASSPAASPKATNPDSFLGTLAGINQVPVGSALSSAQMSAMSKQTDIMKAFREADAATRATRPGSVQIGDFSDHLSALLKQIGGMGGWGGPSAPPAPQVNTEYINNLLAEYGLRPRTDEEIEAHAKAIVDRQKLSKEQIIQRELDRFERDNPPEYAKAQERITTAAKKLGAEQQEEFASRGMYYSSVMSGAVESLDANTMELISDIANESASYVLGLNEELRDIAEWAVVEEEVIRRELEAENTVMKQNLVNIRLQVGMFADQMAFDAWAQYETLKLQHQQVAIQGAQARLQAAMQLGDMYSAAFLLQDPTFAAGAQRMGFSANDINQMGLQQQAALASAVIQGMDYKNQTAYQDLQARQLLANIIWTEGQNINMGFTDQKATTTPAATGGKYIETRASRPSERGGSVRGVPRAELDRILGGLQSSDYRLR